MRAALLVLALSSTAAAQPAEAPHKRPWIARSLSIGTTAIGVGSMYLALHDNKAVLTSSEGVLLYGGALLTLIGPSMGYVYAREKRQAHGTMFAFRMVAGLLWFVGREGANSCRSYPDDCGSAKSTALEWFGAAALIGLSAYDFYDVGRAVERTNRRNALTVAPAIVPTSTGLVVGVVGRL